MTIELNHTIVPARDRLVSARFFARIFGLAYDDAVVGPFAPVRVNDRLTLDFATGEDVRPHHYAFHVSDEEFDAILARIEAEGIDWGGGPFSRADRRINPHGGGRRVYFDDPAGHVLEILTRA